MDTLEIAARTKTKYFVTYEINNETAYFSLLRTNDARYIYSNGRLENIWIYCFHNGIMKDDITLW